jgi:hypothetical protein
LRILPIAFDPNHGASALSDRITCGASGVEQGHEVDLFRAPALPIQRHTKVRSDANPFDPAWNAYFQRRSHAG